jgi:hypothetical protein
VRLDRLFAESRGAGDSRAYASGLRDAVIEAKAALSAMRDQLAVTERELALERRQLADAERRGPLALEIGDSETAGVAERFAARHRERIGVLERKLTVQREELDLGSRELDEMMAELRTAQQGRAPAGGIRPELDLDGELLKAQAERKLHEAAVDAQLAHLKKQLGKE